MISRHVVSLDLARQLKAAVFPQECVHEWWACAGKTFIWNQTDASEFESRRHLLICAAPLLSEIMEQMEWAAISKYNLVDDWRWQAQEGVGDARRFNDHTGPDAAARLWLALKREK